MDCLRINFLNHSLVGLGSISSADDFFGAGLLSFLGGPFIMLPIELAFDSEMQASPVKRTLIFFAVLGFVILVFWSGKAGDYYEL